MENITEVRFVCEGNGKFRRIGSKLLSGLPNLTTVTFLSENDNAGVEAIGENAFADCTSLSTINLPSTLKNIGEGAFSGCTSLSEITIPEGVTTLSESTFGDCTGLETINLPSTVKVIGDRAFMGCSALSKINLPESLERIGTMAFYGCNALESIALPAGYAVIDRRAFASSGLTSLTLPSTVLAVQEQAFEGCKNLTEVTAYANSKLEKIESFAFYDCSALKSFMMPAKVTSIEQEAFSGCILEEVEFSNNLVKLGDDAFAGNQLTSVTIPESVTSLGSAFRYNTLLTEVNLPYTLESLGDAAFSGCTSLQSIELPKNLKSIGECAFKNCERLFRIEIPQGVTSIKHSTFAGCTRLDRITLPDSLETIGISAFQDCEWMSSITLPSTLQSIGYNAFSGCTRLFSVYAQPQTPPVLADKDVFDDSAYSEDSDLKVYTINTDEYENADIWCEMNIANPCSGYAGYNVTYDVKEQDGHYILTLTPVPEKTDYSLFECETGRLPYWLQNAYDYIDRIDSIVINDGITAISDYSLTNLAGIKTVKIPASVTSIGDGAFEGWTSLREMYVDGLNLRESTNLIADDVVYANTIVYTSEPYNFKNATTWRAFAEGNILPYVTGNCGKAYEIDGFRNGEALKYTVKGHTLSIECTVSGGATWIEFEELGISQIEMDGYYYNAPWGGYKDYITDIDLSSMGNTSNIGAYAFYELNNATSVVIPDNVKVIGESAFNKCSALTSVSVPGGVIGESAFEGCRSLTSVTLGDVTEIGLGAFMDCSNLQSITIPESVQSIGLVAFMGCEALQTIQVEWSIPLALSDEEIDGDIYNAFTGLNTTEDGKFDVTLIVPKGLVADYAAAPVWENFISILEEGVVTLVDGTEYTNTEDKACNKIIYTRTFNSADSWQALYIPFGMNYSDWSENFEIARINDVHQWDNDEDGVIDETAVEIVLVKDNIQPNTPYLIKAKEAGTQSITLTETTLSAAEVTPFEVSSWNTNFTFTGTYTGVSGEDMFDNGYYALGGGHLRQAESADNDLSSYRWYMSVTDRNGTPQNLSMVKVVMRNDDGSLTDISEIENSELETRNSSAIYNLSGQRVNKMTKGGVYIQNGKKIFVK